MSLALFKTFLLSWNEIDNSCICAIFTQHTHSFSMLQCVLYMQYDEAAASSPGPGAACTVWAGEVDYLVAEGWMGLWSCFRQPSHHSGSRPPQKTRNTHLVPVLMLTLSPKQARKDNQYPLIATIRILTSFSSRCAAPKKRKEHLAGPLLVIHFLLLSFSFSLFQYVFYVPLKSQQTQQPTPKYLHQSTLPTCLANVPW